MKISFNFETSEFILKGAPSRPDERWEKIGPSAYQTKNLGAAVTYRHCADEVVEKILNHALNEKVPLPKNLPPLPFLDPHQRDGVKWILSRKRSYLAHAPGAGKTAQAIIASLLCEAPGVTFFIVPPSLTENWKREISMWTEKLGVWVSVGVVPLSSEKETMAQRSDIVIVPDSLLARDWVQKFILEKKKIKFIAVDEASRFKEAFSERSLAFYGGSNGEKSFRGIFQKAAHVVFLDGSPIPNRPMEIWAPTFALSPQTIDFMDQDDFGYIYCGPTCNEFGQWEYRGSSNEKELHRKLTRNFMNVVNEDELDHPERLRSMLFMSEDVRSLTQRKWEKSNLGNLRFSDLSEDSCGGELAKFRRELGLRKVPWALKYLRERLEDENESILVFAWHRQVAEALHEGLKESALIIGGTAMKERNRIYDNFQSGRIRSIVGNILAMGRGNNLQKADRVFFVEPSWTDELNKQCEKRASRKGRAQTLSVRCEYLVAPHSMDEPVMRQLFVKQKRVRKIIEGRN